MDDEEQELLEAVAEMEREKYICSIDDYDAVDEMYLISWLDRGGREWSFWGTRRFIETVFDEATLN